MNNEKDLTFSAGLGPFLEDLKRLADVWQHEHPARALGGIRSMAGFNCQLTFALLKTVRSWLQRSGLDQSTPKVFTEILSDILDATSADVAEVVQVKRTMGSGAVHKALDEFSEIYRLAGLHTPRLLPRLRFMILSSRNNLGNIEGSIDNWFQNRNDLPDPREFRGRVYAEILSDPWSELIGLLANEPLKALNPVEIADSWLGRLLSASETGDYSRAGMDVWQDMHRIKNENDPRNQAPAGVYVWQPADRPPDRVERGAVLTGQQPKVRDMREGYFSPRPGVFSDLGRKAMKWIDGNPQQNKGE